MSIKSIIIATYGSSTYKESTKLSKREGRWADFWEIQQHTLKNQWKTRVETKSASRTNLCRCLVGLGTNLGPNVVKNPFQKVIDL